MEYWRGAGYQRIRRCQTDHCNCDACKHEAYLEDLTASGKHVSQNNGLFHHRFVPPSKLGFHDSHTPYYHYGGGGFSSVRTYAEATKLRVKRLEQETLTQQQGHPPLGNQRVDEILSRLNYLFTKNGLGFYDLMKSLNEDTQREKQDTFDRKFQERVATAVSIANAQNSSVPLNSPERQHYGAQPVYQCPTFMRHNNEVPMNHQTPGCQNLRYNQAQINTKMMLESNAYAMTPLPLEQSLFDRPKTYAIQIPEQSFENQEIRMWDSRHHESLRKCSVNENSEIDFFSTKLTRPKTLSKLIGEEDGESTGTDSEESTTSSIRIPQKMCRENCGRVPEMTENNNFCQKISYPSSDIFMGVDLTDAREMDAYYRHAMKSARESRSLETVK